MVKKVVLLIIVLGLVDTASWYSIKREPTAGVSDEKPISIKPNKIEKPNPNKHTFYDTDFAKKMVIHNQQGMLMSDLVANRSSNPELIQLAVEMQLEQGSTTSQYTALLKEWNEQYSNLEDFPEMDGHDMYPTHPGMAAAYQVSKLKTLSGVEFDKLFLQLTIEHHKGAIAMAQEVIGQRIAYWKMVKLRDSTVQKYSQNLTILRKLQNGEKG